MSYQQEIVWATFWRAVHINCWVTVIR